MDSFRAEWVYNIIQSRVGLWIHLSRDKFMVSFRAEVVLKVSFKAAAEVDLHQTRVLTLIKLFYGMMYNNSINVELTSTFYVCSRCMMNCATWWEAGGMSRRTPAPDTTTLYTSKWGTTRRESWWICIQVQMYQPGGLLCKLTQTYATLRIQSKDLIMI